MPFMKATGTKTAMMESGGGEDGQADLRGALPGGGEVVLPLLQVADDVLPHHDGVVDEEPDGQREGHEGHDVEGHAEEVHGDEGGDDGDGEGEAGDDRGAPGVEEAEDDEDREEPAEDEGRLHVLHRFPDHDRAVAHDLDRRCPGAARPGAFDLLLDRVHHAHDVGLGLLEDVEGHGRDAVDEGEGALLLDPVHHLGHLAQGGRGGPRAGRRPWR